MTRLIKLAAALLVSAGITLGVTASPASAHSSTHNVAVSGSMFLLDYERVLADQTGRHQFNGVTTVSPFQAQNAFSTSACVGDELRGELWVTVNDSTDYPGFVQVIVDARLFEGTSCSTGDLDGRRTYNRWVAAGSTSNFAFRVENTEEGNDYIDFNFNVSNHIS